MSDAEEDYFFRLDKALKELRKIAVEARTRSRDPVSEPEIRVARDLAELVEGLVGPEGVAESIRELSDKLSREEMAFKIAEEIIYGKFGHMDTLKTVDQAIRTALAILTEGITAAPIQGVSKVAIKENPDRSKYLAIYFAGPMRSAGGTEQALTLVIGDFVRKLVGLDRYKPSMDEIGRFIEELRIYERSVARFQYNLSDEELRNALLSIPIQVTGVETDAIEVSYYRNLPRIETNRVRGGALRVVNDGIIGRSAKVWKIIDRLGMDGWDWLKDIREVKRKRASSFMDDVIAGRPVFSFASRKGGFRLRYGRARNTGLSSLGIHPLTMGILHGFLASGTQLRIQSPGKAGIVLPVDSIEPPIVRLKDGSVLKVDHKNITSIRDSIEKILFLGDLLVSFGDFLYNNKPLLPSGFTEEWWAEELREALDGLNGDLEEILKIESSRLFQFTENPFIVKPTFREAVKISQELHIPLHPRYVFNWASIDVEELKSFRSWLLKAHFRSGEGSPLMIEGEFIDSIKEILEKLLIPHSILGGKISVSGEEAESLHRLLGLDKPYLEVPDEMESLTAVSKMCGLKILDKFPTSIGARMGRPEKANPRKMRPPVHVLFPVGLSGGSQRNVMKASKRGVVTVELSRRRCPRCGELRFQRFCLQCGVETIFERICVRCHKPLEGDVCPLCNAPAKVSDNIPVDLKGLLNEACRRVGYSPEILKGVKGLTNETKTCEILEKGILRAKYGLYVFKDGTIRFDATNAPLTHFKPTEIGVSIEKLHELGYNENREGKSLRDMNEICELKVQDIIIPRSCAEYFVGVANFIDDLLETVYGSPPFYSVKKIHDLVGHLVIGLAPHTSVGILGRIIGFTDLNICYAHPYWHSAKRRDCDGDEDALILALDAFINFSKFYLPTQIGGIMDAPLFLISLLNPQELQRQAHNFDISSRYPLEFYRKTLEKASPQSVLRYIDTVEKRLGTEAQLNGFGYTTPVSSILLGNSESSYKRLRRMIDKLESQLSLGEKISAVDVREVAMKVLSTHFLPDIAGNLRAFTTQGLRCKACDRRYRRPPLIGVCPACGGELTLTVHRGGIEKYLVYTKRLIEKYDLSRYYSQRVNMIEDEIQLLFEKDGAKQVSLSDYL